MVSPKCSSASITTQTRFSVINDQLLIEKREREMKEEREEKKRKLRPTVCPRPSGSCPSSSVARIFTQHQGDSASNPFSRSERRSGYEHETLPPRYRCGREQPSGQSRSVVSLTACRADLSGGLDSLARSSGWEWVLWRSLRNGLLLLLVGWVLIPDEWWLGPWWC